MSTHILLIAFYTPVIQLKQKDGANATSNMLQDRVIVDFIIQLQSCTTAQQSYRCYADTLAAFGINESIYAMLLGDSDYIALSDYRESFLEAYEEAGGAEADVTVLWSQHENTPLIWNDPINMRMELPEKFHKVEQISADFDIQYGFTLPIHTGIEGFWGSLGLSASGVNEKDFLRDVLPFKDLLIAISTVFDMHIRQISGNHILEQSTVSTLEALTPMEIETLKWLAEGYSIKQISDEKLHRSIDSVNIYIRNAKKKLNARTRDQLIAKALILRLIP